MNKNYNDEQMSEEEIDRELKRVQLQREKMQLEKEIARKKMADKVSEVFGASGNVLLEGLAIVLNKVTKFVRFISRNFLKIVMLVAIFCGAVYGINSLESSRASAFYENRNAYEFANCGHVESVLSCMLESGGSEGCWEKNTEISECRRDAGDKFTKEKKPFLIFRDVS